jgi:hypothetical protein
VRCPNCGNTWRSVSSSGRTRCGGCQERVYVPISLRRAIPLTVRRAVRAPVRTPIVQRPRTVVSQAPQRVPLLAALSGLYEALIAPRTPTAHSAHPSRTVPQKASSEDSERPQNVPVRLHCGHVTGLWGSRDNVVSRELRCAVCGGGRRRWWPSPTEVCEKRKEGHPKSPPAPSPSPSPSGGRPGPVVRVRCALALASSLVLRVGVRRARRFRRRSGVCAFLSPKLSLP